MSQTIITRNADENKFNYFALKNNRLQPIIFIVYLFIFCWLITIIPFFKNAGLGKGQLVILFIIKIMAGFVYAWLFAKPNYIVTADTWHFYKESLTETGWLLRDPVGFIKDLFHSPYNQTGNLFLGVSSYWNDLKDNVFIKLMAVINVFTGKSYYTNIIIFNFLYFFGPMALFKLVQPFWKHKKEWLILPVFLLPSFVFWCSGIHKDGLIFSAMMVSLYCFQKQMVEQRLLLKFSLVILLCFVLLFALRNTILLLLLPCLFALFWSEKKQRYQWPIFMSVYAAGLLLFFASPYVSPSLAFPQYIISKQTEFNALTGNSKVALPALSPTFAGFVKFFPYAVDMAFLRPHISDIKNITYLFSFLENTFVLIVITVWLLFHKPLKNMNPMLLFFIFLSVSLFLLCGYTVTFSGAIVRYKSIGLPLFISFLILNIDWEKSGWQKLIK